MTGHTVKARGVYKSHSVSYVDKGGETRKPLGGGHGDGVGKRGGIAMVDPKVRTYRRYLPDLRRVIGPPC